MNKRITYEQARADHEYLWAISSAGDMTGGYVDQHDLKLLLESPTKATARRCYCAQIDHWFAVPFDDGRTTSAKQIAANPKVREIAIRHGVIEDGEEDHPNE